MTSRDDLLKNTLRLLSYHRQRIWWITSRVFLLALVFTALGLAFRPQYVARTKLTMLPTRSEIGYAARQPEMMLQSPATALGQTYTEAMSSRTLAEDVARTLLANDRAELNNGGVMGHVRRVVIGPVVGAYHRVVTLLNTGRWQTPDPFTSLVEGIQARTKVQNIPGSFVFQIGVTWENPKIAAAIANLIAERHVQMTLKTNREEMRIMREYIETRISETRGELAGLEKRINDYRVGEKLYASATDMDLGLQERSQYERDLNATRVSRAQLDARIDALKPYQTPSAMASIEAERSELKMREETVTKVINEQMGKLDKMPAKEAGLLDLYRGRISLERALSALQDRLLDTKITEAAQLSTVRVIDRAIPPLYPEGPLMLPNAITALIVGLLLSAGVVLVMEARRPGLRSRDDLIAEDGSMLGLIPFMASDAQVIDGHARSDDEQSGGVTRFFRSVAQGRKGTLAQQRTARRHLEHLLQLLTDGAKSKVCLFVSLNGGEGKTYLIEHVAKLAKEADLKVLLLDANFNAPALHHAFGKPLAAGLAEVLSGKAAASAVIVSADKGVDLIGAGLKNLNAQGKWAIETLRQELSQLAVGYDLILIDTAALRSDSSATRLLPLATEVVCVFDAMASQRSDAGEIRQRMGSVPGRMRYILNKKLHGDDHLFDAGVDSRRSEPLARAVPPRSYV